MRPALSLAALGSILVLVAGTFDAEPLYVPGLAFVLVAAASAGWVALAARGVRVSREVSRRRVVEEEPLEVVVRTQAGLLPAPGGALEDPVLGEPVPLRAGMRAARTRIDARFARRGRRRLAAPRVVLRDPLGLATRTVAGSEEHEVLVLPRVEPLRSLVDGDADGAARRRGHPAMAAETELDGVRELRVGTPASRIYWPALARGAGMMERRLRSESDATPLLVLDARVGEREDDLDMAVRATASLAVALARSGGVGVLLPGDRRPAVLDAQLGGWAHLHARLALVPAGGRPSLLPSGRSGPVLYVAAHVPGRAPRGLERAPAGSRVLVVPGTMPGRRPLFAVAGCHGYDLDPARRGRPVRGAAA